MKLAVLAENTTCREDMHPQHGLSIYVETGHHRILFDMGQSDAFVHNAQVLGIDLGKVDIAVLSHGHYDHGGGLAAFFQCNQKAPVYVHRYAFEKLYNGTEKYIGLDSSLKTYPRLIFTEGSRQLLPGIMLTDCNDLGWQFCSYGLNRREENRFAADAFSHEQYMLVREGEKRILFSGCSHKGILNIASHFRPDILIGGFHLNKEERPEVLQQIAEALPEETVYYTGHCTGQMQFQLMRNLMGSRLQAIHTGSIFTI